jgi:signal-transduction protein with cAMP-binding, CBS, and nucleotidyltransferase domain
MRRVNIQAAFVGEPTASQQGLEADDDAEAVVLRVRGGEITLVVPSGTPDDEVVERSTVLRGALRLENERVLTLELHADAVGAFFEDEPTHLHDRREAETGVGMFSGASPLEARASVAGDIMTADPVTVRPNAPTREAAELLAFHGISGLLVCEQDRLVGIVSEADVIGKTGARVADIMTRDVISVPETLPIPEVANLLTQHRIKRVPVVREGRPVGLISRADLVRWVAAR